MPRNRRQRPMFATPRRSRGGVGWLEPEDPQPLSRLRTRTRALWHALFAGPATFLATNRLQRAVTELAYLRDSMDRGLVDAAAGRGR